MKIRLQCAVACAAMLIIGHAIKGQAEEIRLDPRLAKAKASPTGHCHSRGGRPRASKGNQSQIEVAINKFDPQRMETSLDVIKALKPAVYELRSDSKKLIDFEASYLKSLSSLHQSLVAAPDIYRAAGDVFAGYVSDEPFDDLKNEYLEVANDWRKMADQMHNRDEAIKDEGRSLVEFKRYLERSSLFLERLQAHLESFPDFEGQEEREQYLAGMKRYVDGFEGLRQSLHSFHEKLNPAPTNPAPDASTTNSAFGPGTHAGWDQVTAGSRQVIQQHVGSAAAVTSRAAWSRSSNSAFGRSAGDSRISDVGLVRPAPAVRATAAVPSSLTRPSKPYLVDMKTLNLGVVNDPNRVLQTGDSLLVCRSDTGAEVRTATVDSRFGGIAFVRVRW